MDGEGLGAVDMGLAVEVNLGEAMKWEMVDDRGPRRPSLAVEMSGSCSSIDCPAIAIKLFRLSRAAVPRYTQDYRVGGSNNLALQTVTAGSPFHNLHDVESLLWSNGLCLLDGCPLAQPMTLETPRDIWLAGHGCFIAFLDPKSHQRRF
ncbi:hypothetical protein DTO280E4_6758 [Paecilomyces variotii]|nr:hypothetical protein DTO217A2_6647 [Paecilomyces variotii]KAJ9354693.1 hypothetical protein DTO280E4_6758 [Paecilomyces variotii]